MGLLDKVKETGSDLIEKATSEETKEKATVAVGKVANKVEEKYNEINTEENRAKVNKFFDNVSNKLDEVATDISEKISENKEDNQK